MWLLAKKDDRSPSSIIIFITYHENILKGLQCHGSAVTRPESPWKPKVLSGKPNTKNRQDVNVEQINEQTNG